MQLRPRYDGPPVLRFDPPLASPDVPLLRQRRRLATTLATLAPAQWDAPSRCAGWTCRDVVRHLVSVDGFWAASITAGRQGHPTRWLAGFDPVATPAQLVAGAPEATDEALLDELRAGIDAMAAAVGGLDDAGWSAPAEAPPGHLATSEVVTHALWDAWVHERDICLPLGLPVPEEPDEVGGCLRYAVGLGPALAAAAGVTAVRSARVRAVDPDTDLVVATGTEVVVRTAGGGDDGLVEVTGRAVDLVERLSLRTAHPELPEGARWMVEGLSRAFDQEGQPAAGTGSGDGTGT